MAVEYSLETITELADAFGKAEVVRPLRVTHYDAGAELHYDVTGVAPARSAQVRLRVEKFIGGGFAGQVYRVRLLDIAGGEGEIAGLAVGSLYAMKILVPPSNRARKFRNAIYAVGFQSPFSLQVNPAAARAGALWQKLIRRGAAGRFGCERAVVDIYATFIDQTLGSCGELSEWIEGRTWQFEVDDHMLTRWDRQGAKIAGSPEYRAKKQFMAEMVRLFHDMGAPELARQYEWWTCKSQPNVLKRIDSEGGPAAGLTAVDFRAGLALLSLLPMSPGDVPLILKGLARGSVVQFDRGNLAKLQQFVDLRAEEFADMRETIEELKAVERTYRDSQIDVTHNHARLLYCRRLWSTIMDGAVNSWEIRDITDRAATGSFRRSKLKTLLFFLLGLMPLVSPVAGLAVLVASLLTGKLSPGTWAIGLALIIPAPIVGRLMRKVWGRADYREHYGRMLGSWDYFRRAMRAHIAESLIDWHRAGRVNSNHAKAILNRPWLYVLHKPFSLLPAALHRFATDWPYTLSSLKYLAVRPIRLYFNAAVREQWLRDMVADGKTHGMLTDEEAKQIESQISQPFIQKYLKSLAVHVCTLPITQIVSVALAVIWVLTHPERSTAWVEGLGIIGLFQITPVSPGSLVRGLYVLYLVISERNFKDYNIAVFLGFFKYVGYLAFPIQMAYHYPTLSRFMAGHWATGAVHFLPVFGERGALLEHGVFDLFFNYPLTMRRRIRKRMELREALAPRYWHAVPIVLAGAAVFAGINWLFLRNWDSLPTLWTIWYATIVVPLLVGFATASRARGAAISKRIVAATVAGICLGALYGLCHALLQTFAAHGGIDGIDMLGLLGNLARASGWPMFLFAILSTLGAIRAETTAPEPVR